jgi:hypothetical protein
MKIFKRLLRITRIALLAILALCAGEVVLVEGATHDGIYFNGQALAAAGNWLAKSGFTETKLSVR